VAVLAGAAMLLAGCGSVVYQDAATTYVATGKAAVKSMTDAATTLAAAQDRLKAAAIVTDAACPVGEPRIFVRDAKVRGVFTAAMARIPDLPRSAECERLKQCDGPAGGQGCSSVCYSAPEANCIAQVETDTALRLKSLPPDQAEQFAAASKPLAQALERVEYGRSAPVQNMLVKSSLASLLDYLDMLDKLATRRDSEVAGDAKGLSDRITSAGTQITQITGRQLSAADKASENQVTGAITAMGKFVADMQDIAAHADDAAAIRKLVAGRSADVQGLIVSIKEVAIGDAMLGAVYQNLGDLDARAALQDHFAAARDPYERSLILAERDRFSYSDGTQIKASVSALFDAMAKSHDALVKLVLHPDDKDLQAISNARFQEFKTVAADVVALLQLFR
jgi:hypothetical protein